jgi:hypothetical protein
VVMFREQDVRNFYSITGYDLYLYSTKRLSFFHHVNHLRFKFELSEEIQLNEINLLNIANTSRNVSKVNM